jgi:hypothetical protein
MELREQVREMLIKFPSLRDDNPRLCTKIWRWQLMELGKMQPEKIPFDSFSKEYEDGKLSQADSITRQSRLLQETHPELRGERREKKEFQEEVKNMVATYKAERVRP